MTSFSCYGNSDVIATLFPNLCLWRRSLCSTWEVLGTLRSDDGDDNENVKKAIGLIAKPTILHVHHALLYISFQSLHDHDVKMPNRCTEGEHKRLRNFPPLSELGYGSYEFNFRRVHLHLTKLVTWSNRDEDWKNKNSLFQQRFRCRRRPRILRSLLTPKNSIKPL